MYNLNGIELDLNEELLKEYSNLAVAKPGSELFNTRLTIIVEDALQTNSLEKAVDLYGINIISKKITKAIEDELDIFSIERE